MAAAQQQPQWDPEFEPIVKLLLHGKDKIKVKGAVEVGRRACEYFRGADFAKWVYAHGELLKKRHGAATEGLELEKGRDAEKLGERLMRKGFVYRASFKPLEGTDEAADPSKRPKWPKRLVSTPSMVFDEREFYIVRWEGSKTTSHLILAAIILAVLAMVMFPAWPLGAKIGVWYLSVFLLTFLFVLIIGRLVLFLCLWFMGGDFWLLPNLFAEDCGFVDSFIPLYSWEYRKDDWTMVLVRIACFVIAALGLYQLSQTHSIDDVRNFARDSFVDILEWGEKKLAALPEAKQRYPSLQDVQNMTQHDEDETHHADGTPKVQTPEEPAAPAHEEAAEVVKDEGPKFDFSCLESCDFKVTSIADLDAECTSDCSCAKDLIALKCFKACPEDTKQQITKARDRACKRDDL